MARTLWNCLKDNSVLDQSIRLWGAILFLKWLEGLVVIFWSHFQNRKWLRLACIMQDKDDDSTADDLESLRGKSLSVGMIMLTWCSFLIWNLFLPELELICIISFWPAAFSEPSECIRRQPCWAFEVETQVRISARDRLQATVKHSANFFPSLI